MKADLAPIPAAGDYFSKYLYTAVILAPGIQVEIPGNENVAVMQRCLFVLIGIANKHIEKGVNPAFHIGAVQMEAGQVKGEAVVHLNDRHL